MISPFNHATKTLERVRAFFHRYERVIMPAMLLGGTGFDVLQFRVLDLRQQFVVMLVYVAIVMGSMLLATVHTKRTLTGRGWTYATILAPFSQQFAMGGLLSTALLFYWFSGSIAVTWPLVGLVAILMISNETLRHIVTKPVVQIGILYFSLFSLFAIWFAHMFVSLSWPVFVAGGVTSMVVMTLLLILLVRLGDLYAKKTAMWATIAGVFLAMNGLYFFNIIPPIPLALREAKMAYNVASDYTLTVPEETWVDRLLPGRTIAIAPGQPLFAYSAVYAPEDVTTVIVHVWQRYDEDRGSWETVHKLPYQIVGGRIDGYRGFSMVSALGAGRWRVSIETPSGQVLGRLGFRVVPTVTP